MCKEYIKTFFKKCATILISVFYYFVFTFTTNIYTE